MRDTGKDGFFQEVYDLVAQIPPGRAATYGQLAAMLGRPNGARQVGWAMRCCPSCLPWQRVVRADGSIAAAEGTLAWAMLEAEGVPFLHDGRVNLNACQWDGLHFPGNVI